MENSKKTISIGRDGKLMNLTDIHSTEEYLITKNFNVTTNKNPDFMICSSGRGGRPFEFLRRGKVRIFLAGDGLTPEFNLFDYCIGSANLEFGDRYYRMPRSLWYLAEESNREIKKTLIKRHENIVDNNILTSKDIFCDFIYSHKSFDGKREEMLDTLSSYKDITCAGSYKNNMANNEYANTFAYSNYDQKIMYQKRSKFSIAMEPLTLMDYESEKIIHPFYCRSIPIYYGNSNITSLYNSKAFINSHDYNSFDEVLKRVIELDNDDEAYLEMLNQPVFNDSQIVDKYIDGFEDFLFNILNQDPEEAQRRLKYNVTPILEHYLLKYSSLEYIQKQIKRIFFYIKRTFEEMRERGLSSTLTKIRFYLKK